MNKGGSDDSLNNSDVVPICWSSSSSSSSLSDDAPTSNKHYLNSLMSNDFSQPYKLGNHQTMMNNYGQDLYVDYQSTHHRPILGSSQRGQIDRSQNTLASLYGESSALASSALTSGIPDVVPDPRSIALRPDESFGLRCNDQNDKNNLNRLILGRRREYYNKTRNMASPLGDHTSSNIISNADIDNDYSIDQEEIYHNNEPAPIALPGLTGPSEHSGNMITKGICHRLLDYATLEEMEDYIESSREVIEDVISIIREAPAYRNYNISDYQIDYSIKQSFNPNFWLDREPVVTTADGNCQYHAVSMSLTGSELYTPEVRLAAAVAVLDNREYFESILRLTDKGSVYEMMRTILRSYSWGDETTLKAIAIAINKRIFLYTCNFGRKDYDMVRTLSKEELLDAFREKKYRGGTGIHAYADPLIHVPANDYIMLFHKSEHFIAVLPTTPQPTMFEPYNPIVPVFD